MGCGGSNATPVNVEYDWQALNAKLPSAKEDREKRIEIWTNVLGMKPKDSCPLDVLQDKLTKHLELPEEMAKRGPMKKAYDAAKDKYKKEGEQGDDALQWNEFRIFLIFLKQYFEYYQMFKALDNSGDMRLSIEEFKKALPSLKNWGVEIPEDQVETEWQAINSGGGNDVDFDEFCAYAIKKSLDCNGDEDDPALDMIQQ